jgi:hypothetical protein
MSDAGIVPFKRRSGRIQKIDPITQSIGQKWTLEEEIEVIEQSKDLVQECVDFA